MKLKLPFVAAALLAAWLLAACGPSEAQRAATSTQIAADIFATQTAGAPTATATFTPSATPTDTPTPTLTPTATHTPTPSDTPTPTPTPAPVLMPAALTLNDLPAGFGRLGGDSVRTMQKGMPADSFAFGFSDETKGQALIGVLIPYPTRVGQAALDSTLGTFVDATLSGFGNATAIKPLRGLEDVGDVRVAKTALSKSGSLTLRWDIVAFRRGSVVVLLLFGHPEGDKLPAKSLADLAHIQDERIIQFLSTNPIGLARDRRPVAGSVAVFYSSGAR
jgi:hypothetical protein